MTTSVTQYNIMQQLTSVKAASPSNISGTYINGTLNNGVGATLTATAAAALTIDGISLEVGDRVLLFSQTNGNENGVYVVNSAGSATSIWQLQRAPDQQSMEQLKPGQFLSVEQGETYAGTMFVVLGPLPAALGVDDLTYQVTSGSGIAKVAISSAEFKGMYAAPKLLVPAQGANTLIVLERLELLMTYNSIAYANGGTAAVQYDSTANGAGVIASTTLANTVFQPTASTGFNFNAGVVAQTFSTCVNKGLYLSNITGAFDTGNSAFVAFVWYKVIPTV